MATNFKQSALLLLLALAAIAHAAEPASKPADDSAQRRYMGIPEKLANPKTIVYLCDGSDNAKASFDTLRAQLQKAVNELHNNESFSIIIFADGKCQSLNPELIPANAANGKRATEFLDKLKPHGKSDPTPGLRAAFAAKPEVIYFLAAGPFANSDRIVPEIRKLNSDGKVLIPTIAFMERDEKSETLLNQIARENGGIFKIVSDVALTADKAPSTKDATKPESPASAPTIKP